MKALLFALVLLPSVLIAGTPMDILVVCRTRPDVPTVLKEGFPGVKIEEVSDPNVALDIIGTNRPDLVIIAGHPSGSYEMTGWMLLGKIQKKEPNLPVIQMSRLDGEKAERQLKLARAKPATLYLQKPFTADQLLAAVKSIYESSPAQRTAAR